VTAIRRALIAAGVLAMAYAVGGVLLDSDVSVAGVAVFGVAVIVLHDGVFLPTVLGAGALINRLAPPRWRATVQVAALISLAVAVVAVPFVLGFGRRPDNPSALPSAYGRGLLLIVGLIWLVAVVRKVLARRSTRRDG
jgi:hypothetical protein